MLFDFVVIWSFYHSIPPPPQKKNNKMKKGSSDENWYLGKSEEYE